MYARLTGSQQAPTPHRPAPMAAAASPPRVLTQACRSAGRDKTLGVAATFGASLFDALAVPEAAPFTSTPLAEMKAVRVQEQWRGEDAVAVVGPDLRGVPGVPLMLGRAVDHPSTNSVQCPAQGLAAAHWYRDHQRRMPHMRLGVVGAIFDAAGRVLLTRRAPHMRSFPGSWVLPGGGLDPGETMRDAVIREVKEEAGVALAEDSVQPVGLWESVFPTSTAECIATGTGITAHYLVVFYAAQALVEAPAVTLQAEETDMAVWLSAEQVAEALAHPLGGASGTVDAAAAAPGLPTTVPLDELAGIYPRPAAATTGAVGRGTGAAQVGIAQGNLFILSELLSQDDQGGSFFSLPSAAATSADGPAKL